MGNSIQQEVVARFDFSKGINTRFPKVSLQENEVVDAYNLQIRPRGGLRKRSGLVKALSTDTADATKPIVGLYQFRSPTTDLIVRLRDSKVEKLGASSWDDRTNGMLVTANPDNTPVFTTHRKNMILTDGVNPVIRWTGASTGFVALAKQIDAAPVTTMERAKTVVTHRERLIFGDVDLIEGGVLTRYESRLIATVAGTLETWDDTSTGHRLDIGDGDGDSITALMDIYGVLLVWKQHSLWKVVSYGLPGVMETRKIADVGTLSPRAVVAVGTSAYFLDAQGHLWRFQVFGQDEDSLTNLSVDRFGAPILEAFNMDRLDKARLAYSTEWGEIRCLFSMLDEEENNHFWVYNVIADGWTRFEYSVPISEIARVRDVHGTPRIIVGGYNGIVYQADSSNADDGAAIENALITRADAFEAAHLIKRLANIHIYVKAKPGTSTTFSLEVRDDFHETGGGEDVVVTPPGNDTDPPLPPIADDDTSSPPTDTPPELGGGTGDDPIIPITEIAAPGGIEIYDVEPHPTLNNYYWMQSPDLGDPRTLTVKSFSSATHAELWSTNVVSMWQASAVNIKYIAGSNTLWISVGRTLNGDDSSKAIYILNADTGAVVSSFTTAAKGLPSPAGQLRVVGEWSSYVLLRDATADNYHLINKTTFAVQAQAMTHGFTSPSIDQIVGDRLYVQEGADEVAAATMVSSGNFTELADSDHGNLGAAGYGAGTPNASYSADTIAYDPDHQLFHQIIHQDADSDILNYQIVSSGPVTHPDGTPHSPSHTYLPSNNSPGTNIKDTTLAIQSLFKNNGRGLIYANDRERLFLSYRNAATTYYIVKIKPAFTYSELASASIEQSLSFTAGSGLQGYQIFVPGNQRVVVVTTDGFRKIVA